MRFNSNEYNEDVISTFNPTGLVIASTMLKTANGNVVVQENTPAGVLFDKTTARPEGDGFILIRDKRDIAYVESSAGQGSKWRYYNNADKSIADMVYLLVDGDPQYDLCEINLVLDVTKLDNGIVQIINNTIINGQHWTDFQPNKTAQRIGFQYTVNNVQEPDSYSGLMYLPAGGRNFNQAGSTRSYINLTTVAGTPISTDKEGESQRFTHTDYIVKAADIADSNIESFGITMVWLQDGNPKNQSETMLTPLTEILK